MSQEQHGIRLAANPGRDGGTFSTQSQEFKLFGAVGVLLKTSGEPEPRYLLWQRADDLCDDGKWYFLAGQDVVRKPPEKPRAVN